MVARRHVFSWRQHRAVARDADFLDGVVEAQLELVRQLPIDQRDELAEALAVLVMLAQDHRYYLRDWINRRELRHRTQRALVSLDALGESPAAPSALPRPRPVGGPSPWGRRTVGG
ncbi:MAG: hypothetical protein JO287_04965 [Pseudonocardiales bacterium]|nr:hypothetical protein [Pseudonocardiales bacterium]